MNIDNYTGHPAAFSFQVINCLESLCHTLSGLIVVIVYELFSLIVPHTTGCVS